MDMREENGISHVDWVRQNKWEGFGVGFWGRAASGGDFGAGHGQKRDQDISCRDRFFHEEYMAIPAIVPSVGGGGLIALGPVTLEL